MDSTNNEIYKIAKYLDKYTKYGNKEGGVYLQKLDNYLHKVQYGGNGDIVKLAQQIGDIVTRVVKKHQEAKGELGEMVKGIDGSNLEDRIQNKMKALQVEKEGLEKTIAQKEEAKLAREASSASSVPAPEAVTFDALTRDNIKTINDIDLANIIINFLKTKLKQEINDDHKLQEQITKIGIRTNESNWWNFSNLFQKIYNGNAKDYFSQDNTTVILAINIIIALINIRYQSISTSIVNTEWEQKISELEQIIRLIIISSNENCKEIISKLFIDFVNIGQPITSSNFTVFIEKDWRYLVSCKSDADFKSTLFTREIIAKEVFRRMSITDTQKIQKIVEAFNIVKISWFVDSNRTFISYLSFLYNSQYFKDNAKLAIDCAKELMVMKFEAIEIRVSLGQKLSALGIESIESDKEKFRQQTGQIDEIFQYINNDVDKIKLFIDYVIQEQGVNSVPTLTNFKIYESSKASTVLRNTVPPSADVQAQQALAIQLGREAVQVQQASTLKSVPQKDPKNPTSMKFDIVGFFINKDRRQITYLIPEQQKEKVLEVLPQELKEQLENQNVQLLSENKKARIIFNKFLPIKEILRQINERDSLQPTEFKSMDMQGNITDKTRNVWLFIVPITYNLELTTKNTREYYDAINKIEEEELGKIASKMEGIITERQPVAQSSRGRGVIAQPSRGRGARGGQARGGSMISRGPYRHPLTSE